MFAHCYTAQGYSDYLYTGETDGLNCAIWHSAQGGPAFDLAHYSYLNGRSSRLELETLSSDGQSLVSTKTYYLQYNWHGDATAKIDPTTGAGMIGAV